MTPGYNAYSRDIRIRSISPSGRKLLPDERWGTTPLKATNEAPNPHYYVYHQENLGSPTGREPYGDGAAIVVREWESHLHGEGRQVFLIGRQ